MGRANKVEVVSLMCCNIGHEPESTMGFLTWQR